MIFTIGSSGNRRWTALVNYPARSFSKSASQAERKNRRLRMKKLGVLVGTLLFVMILTLSLSLPVVAEANPLSSSPTGLNQTAVDSSADGQTINLQAAEDLIVTLTSNHSTGYSWAVVQITDNNVLKEIGHQYIPSPSGLLGSGGTEVWTFQAVRPGISSLTMAYTRFDGSGDRTFNLKVNVLSGVPASTNAGLGIIVIVLCGLMAILVIRRVHLQR
jgi:inhibitor of cysteine peptidase